MDKKVSEAKRVLSLLWMFGFPAAILMFMGGYGVLIIDAGNYYYNAMFFLGVWYGMLTSLMIFKRWANKEADSHVKEQKKLNRIEKKVNIDA